MQDHHHFFDLTCHTLLLGPQVFWQDGDRRVRLTTGEVEKVGLIVDRWITGTETGDTQVRMRGQGNDSPLVEHNQKHNTSCQDSSRVLGVNK
jgi:hypothetical protein